MNKTPRTDAKVSAKKIAMEPIDMDLIDFARELKRENAELREQLKHSDACLEAMTKAEHEEVNANAELRAKLDAASQAYNCAMAVHGTVMEESYRIKEENVELRRDKERLDFLEKEACWVFGSPEKRGLYVRAAIDAAKEASP